MKRQSKSLTFALITIAAPVATIAVVTCSEALAITAVLAAAAAALSALPTGHERAVSGDGVLPGIGPEVPAPASDAPASAPPAAPEPARASALRELERPQGAEPADVLSALLESVECAGDVLSAHLWLEDPATSTLRLLAVEGTVFPTAVPVAISDTILGAALTQDAARLGIERVHLCGRGETTVWRYAVPLEAGVARGAAAVDLQGDAEPDATVLNYAAAGLRGALSGALALHVARSETAAARALIDAGLELSRLLDANAVMEAALRRGMELAQAQTGSIMLVDETTGHLHIAASSGLSAEVVEDTEVSEGEGIAGWVFHSRQPLIVEDLDNRGPRSRRHGVRSAISVPIADDDGALGVLNVGSRAFHARFSQSHLEVLSSIGRSTAVALRNALAVRCAQDLYFDTLKALALAFETKDPFTRGGTSRVVEYAVAVGTYLGLTSAEAEALRTAAMLHDVGMSAAGEMVAVSKRPLSTVEWGMLKMHPVIAAEILAQTPALREVIPIVYHHHEHFDGTGYVAGLSGEGIPLGARILAVADAYVAMTSDRPHRGAMSRAEAIGELREGSGNQFDPDVVTALIELTGTTNERVTSIVD